jgi:succinate-semialdehyde dehydrogenase / glutarate-semialdehyde dehydrogenase
MSAVVDRKVSPPVLKDPALFRDRCYVDGAWLEADSGRRFDVDNPGDGSIVGSVPDMGASETKRAIAAAERALPAWRALPAKERSKIVRRWYELIMTHADDLALLLTTEQGKPLAEARGEVAYAAGFLEWFGEEAKRVYGDVVPSPWPDRRIVVLKQAVGVVAAITPWNFPAAMLTRKAGAALAAGCTVVAKPASRTPLTALALARLAERAGLPAGVLNVVTGDPVAIGGALMGSPLVRKLSFTGSTEVGRLLMAQCAPTIRKLSLELGGNAPFIVFDDADLDAALDGAVASKYRNSGQTCVCTNRFLVQAGIYERFVAGLAQRVTGLKVSDGREPGATQGPLIDAAALAKVLAHVDDARRKGARVLAGGAPHALGGTFFQPTVLADVTADMLCVQEETFGPVAPVVRFATEDEAIGMANDTVFGLAAYFYTRDLARTWRVGERLEYGMVGVNTGMISNEVAPFGGVKQSGMGREGSKYGIESFLEIKYLAFAGL